LLADAWRLWQACDSTVPAATRLEATAWSASARPRLTSDPSGITSRQKLERWCLQKQQRFEDGISSRLRSALADAARLYKYCSLRCPGEAEAGAIVSNMEDGTPGQDACDRFHAERDDVRAAMLHAWLVLDGAEELESMWAQRFAEWRNSQGTLRPSLRYEGEQATQARTDAHAECEELEASWSSLSQALQQAEFARSRAVDATDVKPILHNLRKVHEDLNGFAIAESNSKAQLQHEVDWLEAQCAQLQGKLVADRDLFQEDAKRRGLVLQSELGTERELQRRVQQQLEEERAKALYLEQEYQACMENSEKKFEQAAKLQAIAVQVDRLTRERQFRLEGRQRAARPGDL